MLRYRTREYKSSSLHHSTLSCVYRMRNLFLVLLFPSHQQKQKQKQPERRCHSNCSWWIHPLALNKVLVVPWNRKSDNRSIARIHIFYCLIIYQSSAQYLISSNILSSLCDIKWNDKDKDKGKRWRPERLLNRWRRIYLAWMPATRVTTTPLAPWPESI